VDVVGMMYKAMPDVSQLLHLVDWRFISSRHKIGVRRLPFNMATCIAPPPPCKGYRGSLRVWQMPCQQSMPLSSNKVVEIDCSKVT
jgi:hypothetical protein